jgi:hypothetical protein
MITIEVDFWGRPAGVASADDVARGYTPDTMTIDMPGKAGAALVATIRGGKAGAGFGRSTGHVSYSDLAQGYEAAAAGALVDGDKEAAARHRASAARMRETSIIVNSIGSMRDAANAPAERSNVLTVSDLVATARALGNRWSAACLLIGETLSMDMTGQPTLFDAPADPNPVTFGRSGSRPANRPRARKARPARFDAAAVKRLHATLPPVHLVAYGPTGTPATDPTNLVDVTHTPLHKLPAGYLTRKAPAMTATTTAPAEAEVHPFVAAIGTRRCAATGCDRGRTAKIHRVPVEAPAPAAPVAEAPAVDQVNALAAEATAVCECGQTVALVGIGSPILASHDAPAGALCVKSGHAPAAPAAPAPVVDQVDAVEVREARATGTATAPVRVSAVVLATLRASTWSHAVIGRRGAREGMHALTLPAGRLDRDAYVAVRDAVAAMGGHWSKEARAFVFHQSRPCFPNGHTRDGRADAEAIMARMVDADAPAEAETAAPAPAAPVDAVALVDAMRQTIREIGAGRLAHVKTARGGLSSAVTWCAHLVGRMPAGTVATASDVIDRTTPLTCPACGHLAECVRPGCTVCAVIMGACDRDGCELCADITAAGAPAAEAPAPAPASTVAAPPATPVVWQAPAPVDQVNAPAEATTTAPAPAAPVVKAPAVSPAKRPVPADLCSVHADQYREWRGVRFDVRNPTQWPGGSIHMDSRTSVAAQCADWDRKTSAQMDLIEKICRSGNSSQCVRVPVAEAPAVDQVDADAPAEAGPVTLAEAEARGRYRIDAWSRRETLPPVVEAPADGRTGHVWCKSDLYASRGLPAVTWCGEIGPDLPADQIGYSYELGAVLVAVGAGPVRHTRGAAITCTVCAHRLACRMVGGDCEQCAAGAAVRRAAIAAATTPAPAVDQAEAPAPVTTTSEEAPVMPAPAAAPAAPVAIPAPAPAATTAKRYRATITGRGEVDGYALRVTGKVDRATAKEIKRTLYAEREALGGVFWVLTSERGTLGIVPAEGAEAPADWSRVVARAAELLAASAEAPAGA